MNVRWKKLLIQSSLWLVAEIWFNFLEIDDLVDYGEFIFARNEIVVMLLIPISREKS